MKDQTVEFLHLLEALRTTVSQEETLCCTQYTAGRRDMKAQAVEFLHLLEAISKTESEDNDTYVLYTHY